MSCEFVILRGRRKGTPCGNRAVKGTAFCCRHSPVCGMPHSMYYNRGKYSIDSAVLAAEPALLNKIEVDSAEVKVLSNYLRREPPMVLVRCVCGRDVMFGTGHEC